MSKSLTLAKNGEEVYVFSENLKDFTCDKCGENFTKPILAKVSSGDNLQVYYACPRCLAKVGDAKTQKGEESKDIVALKKEDDKTFEKFESKAECEHFLGYLKKRPKNTPIPDECLICDKMIECIVS
jgi:hypothetical protein